MFYYTFCSVHLKHVPKRKIYNKYKLFLNPPKCVIQYKSNQGEIGDYRYNYAVKPD